MSSFQKEKFNVFLKLLKKKRTKEVKKLNDTKREERRAQKREIERRVEVLTRHFLTRHANKPIDQCSFFYNFFSLAFPFHFQL